MALELIDKNDGFEIVRDKIASILVTEVASQQVIALAAGKDPDLWKLRVYLERSNAWEQWVNIEEVTDYSPIVNVYFDTATYNERYGDTVERQRSDSIYNIDCYAIGVSEESLAGHKIGDKEAALNAHRAARLVRNILMAGENTYLGLRGSVWGRWPQSLTVLQPEMNGQSLQHIICARWVFRVSHNEFSPQVAGETMEQINVTMTRSADGLVSFTHEVNF